MGKTASIIIALSLMSAEANSQSTIYLFPGQGSDERLFSGLQFDSKYKIVHIKYPVPEKGMSLPEFARMLGKQIDTSEKYYFIGVSLGGMICTELSEIFHPQKTIIISSAKSSRELPFRYNFQKYLPLYKIVPPSLYRSGALLLQPIVEPDRNKQKEVFKNMLREKDKIYLKRSVAMIIEWQRKGHHSNIIHIHGDNDHTIPIRHTKPDIVIDKGSHMMTLTQSEKVSRIVSGLLD